MDLRSYILEAVEPILPVYEGIRSRDVEKAIGLMRSYLNKRKIYTIPRIHQLSIDNKPKLGVYVFTEKNEGAMFVWTLAESSQVETVLFTKDFDASYASAIKGGSFSFDLMVEAKGANTVQMLKLVEAVLTGKVQMKDSAVRAHISDAQLFESAFFKTPKMVNEAGDPVEELKKKTQALYMRIRSYKKKGTNANLIPELEKEYEELKKRLAEARLSVKPNVVVTSTPDAEVEKVQDYFEEEEERATPEERFSDMQAYIYSVITGRRALALLCGAPGVGKTYRVMQTIKGTGKEMGQDYKILKGKITPSALYTTLHDYKNAGQIMIMDDCDSVFKDQDAINLLKAAYDSSDERWVTWGISSPIPMSEEMAQMCDDAVYNEKKNRWEYPKEFLYEGGGIIITNYRAGQIDTAVRNRALICDLSFTVDEVLGLIRDLMPKIGPDLYSMEAKEKAIAYLEELAHKGAPVELSIRSFTSCADLYMSDAPEKTVRRRIAEQMRNQFMVGGKKY